MDYTLNDSSLKSSTRYLWDKLLIKKILKTLNDFKNEEKTSGSRRGMEIELNQTWVADICQTMTD